jgi:hypothetical protein
MVYVVFVIVEVSGENTGCIPTKQILLSNCSFNYLYSNLTIDYRTLSMTVPYSLNNNQEEESNFLQILTHERSSKPLIRFNLNMIQCLNKNLFNWTSVESSSTLRGEFVRTTFIDTNMMYLSSGVTYLRNLTMSDCLTKTIYRTNNQELFQINLRIESTLNDFCSKDNLCYPLDIYQCDYNKQRCICRSHLESYTTKDQYSICIHPVKDIDQCPMQNIRCLEWCHRNRSSIMCICPKDVSIKKYLDNDRGRTIRLFCRILFLTFLLLAYCEGRMNGKCNSFIQCPVEYMCAHGICQNTDYQLQRFLSFDIVTISIIVSSVIFLVIIIILGISIYILRRRRWNKRYHSSIDCVYKKKQQTKIPTTSEYDNIIYGVFRHNVQLSSTLLSSNDDNINETSTFTTSDSSSYHPKVVFLGGEQQLTAIYA